MKSTLALATTIYVGSTFAAGCDCTVYPFKPNPPCYGQCVAQLSSPNSPDLARVKNLDPGVAVGIHVLRDSPSGGFVDYKGIRGKNDLEREALKSLRQRESGAIK